MKRKIIALSLVLFYMTSIPLTIRAESQTYTPPARKGVIFVVVRFKEYNSRDQFPKTNVKVKWGNYNRSKDFSANFSMRTVGVVIRLRHDNNDSLPLTVETDGRFGRRVEQMTSSPPEWTDRNYQKVDW